MIRSWSQELLIPSMKSTKNLRRIKGKIPVLSYPKKLKNRKTSRSMKRIISWVVTSRSSRNASSAKFRWKELTTRMMRRVCKKLKPTCRNWSWSTCLTCSTSAAPKLIPKRISFAYPCWTASPTISLKSISYQETQVERLMKLRI